MSDGRALYGLKRKAPPTLCDPRELEERGRGSKLALLLDSFGTFLIGQKIASSAKKKLTFVCVFEQI
jgi:hypothetical protein